MGNCLVLQEKAAIVIKTDDEILKHKSPIKGDQASHATSDELHVVKSMHPKADQVLQNHLHLATKTMKKKKDRFSDKVLEGEDQASRVVRIKVVISKKELQKMLSEGEVSVDGMILKVQNQEIINKAESNDRDEKIAKGWFPALESIPEIN